MGLHVGVALDRAGVQLELVQVRAVFEKVGVRSRRELVAQIFFQHSVPRLQTGAPIGATGWFADAS